jgi:hypothetical protein
MKYRKDLDRTDVSGEFLGSVLLLLVTVNLVPISLILSSLMMNLLQSSETSVLTRTIRHKIPEYGILHRHRRESFKS